MKQAGIRPRPPAELLVPSAAPLFVPAPELVSWAHRTFIAEGAPLENEEHLHLRMARVAALWTNEPAKRQQRAIAGTAEMPMFRGMPWVKARQEAQMHAWFGDVPDFVLTFYAPYAVAVDDVTFCALVEHELMHCGQARDEFGMPKFRKSDGRPVFAMRGHDAEEFVGIVRRYGVGAAAAGVSALVLAASRPPEIAAASVAGACGICLRAVA